GLQHHLSQLLHEQRHPIGLGYNLGDPLRGEGLAVRYPADDLRGLWTRQAMQYHLGEVRAPGPGRDEAGPLGEQSQDVGGGALIDQEAEKLQDLGQDFIKVHQRPSICTNAASLWSTQNIMSMARYNARAADSSGRICTSLVGGH